MSNINNYVRPSDFGADRKDINRILEMIHDVVAQEPEDAGLQQRILVRDHVKRRTTTVTFGSATLLNTDVRDKENFHWRRKKPASVDTYNLIHTTTGTLTFPVSDTKFGARCDFDGSSFIKIDDDSILKPTNKITIAGWFYLIKNSTTQHIIKMQESNTSYNLRILNTNRLKFRIRTDNAGGTTYDKEILAGNWTDNQWNHIVVTWSGAPDNRLRIYLNKVKDGADVVTAGALQYSGSDGLGIGAGPNGGSNIITSGSRMATISVLNEEVDQTWINNHFDGLLDTSDGNDEITTIAFIGDDRDTPNAETGLFKSS